MSRTHDGPSYYPNDALAAVIVKAWQHPEFKARLLSGADLRNKDRTKTALDEMGISLTDVVVLSPGEYEGYRPAQGQTVFVLPDPIGIPSMETARIAMASTVCGI